MITIKVSTPWNHDLYNQTPGRRGIFKNYIFEIDNNCAECDYWIVWGNLKQKMKIKCPPDNIIYITDETHSERKFNQDFLNQFPTVIACRKDLDHSHIIYSHDLGIWHFNKCFDHIVDLKPFRKDKTISVVASDLTWLPGHKNRFAFVNKLIGHFKDDIEAFGRGINPINDKYEGIAPYKYSVAIENSYIESYFTEKICECFLTYTLPIYYGCPNLETYFDERSFIRIDIDDYKTAFRTIEEVINNDIYNEKLKFIRESREIYLNEYHVFPAIIKIIKKHFSANKKNIKLRHTLRPERHYAENHIEKVLNLFNYVKKKPAFFFSF